MNAIATKFKVTAAALALGAGAALTPAVAHSAPAVQVPAAPVQQVVGGVAEAPGDFIYYSRVVSLQVLAANIRFTSAVLESRANRLQAYAAAYPNTLFGQWAAQAAQRTLERRAAYGALTFSACRGDSGIQVGPYGTVTSGPC